MEPTDRPKKKYKYRRKFAERVVGRRRCPALEAMREACRSQGVILTSQDEILILSQSQGSMGQLNPNI
ncbi:MAG TPA: hypothetical protein VHE12_05875 [bacterium]|nr:hypothetical protein [bacterium]